MIPKVYNDITSRDFDYIWGVSLDGQVLQLMLKTGELKKSSIKLSREECFFIYMKEIK
ncbi:wfeC [Escherichia coli]|nr:wfeC [Escherichia coli]